ncbi:AMP-binding protein [Pseudarthrobacter sp. J64]|uniref:class I adenylate-forming enzyme family protein n=1 Tax=Pseudarthrobacter sp. J64 TaxID=3116485 RepID=UPI002E81F2B6|nr:AMP-binding protein [Pseudarthrobacter sp. J64]MEE2569055.1 AMP-binding protein [Pseudarthrobacter sp. J64]
MPFLDRLQRWADDRPDAPAVVVSGRYLSWSELCDEATALLPQTPGISLLELPNSVDFAVAFAAGVAGTRECAVLDPTWPDSIRHGVRDRLAEFIRTGQAADPESPLAQELTDGPPDTPFLIGFTSGTTSIPKAFTRSRRSWQLSFEASKEFFGLRPDDVTLAPGPLSASLNLYALAECLYAGTQFNTLESFDVADVHQAVAFDGVTRLVLVPTMLRLLSERGLAGGVDASGIRTIICAGSKLDARTLEAARRWAPGATIYEYYGASELSFVAGSGLPPGEPARAGNTRIGRPFPGVEIRILGGSPDPGAPGTTELPEGVPGSVCVRSGMVSNGYLWGDDGEALRSFDGWYTVGDQGYLADGALHILGRRSDMIQAAGINVYPHEVELALTSIPGVTSAVAVGLPDDLRGQKVVAGIVPAHGALTVTQVRTALSDLLAREKRPQSYYLLSELPVTDRGKLSRGLLREWIETNDARVAHLG